MNDRSIKESFKDSTSSHRIIFGDARNMEELDNESVSMAVTSPPYVTTKMEKGQDFKYQEHLELCKSVFEETYRVLIPDGRFILNVGDIYTKYLHDDDKYCRFQCRKYSTMLADHRP